MGWISEEEEKEVEKDTDEMNKKKGQWVEGGEREGEEQKRVGGRKKLGEEKDGRSRGRRAKRSWCQASVQPTWWPHPLSVLYSNKNFKKKNSLKKINPKKYLDKVCITKQVFFFHFLFFFFFFSQIIDCCCALMTNFLSTVQPLVSPGEGICSARITWFSQHQRRILLYMYIHNLTAVMLQCCPGGAQPRKNTQS